MYNLTLVTTEKCNAQCKYCYQSNYRDQNKLRDMDLDDFITGFGKIVKSLGAIGLIQFFGGEMTLQTDMIVAIDEYLDRVVAAGILERKPTYAFSTNLVALPAKFVQLLDKLLAEKHKFYVSTSVDGPKELHDANRLFGTRSAFENIYDNYQFLLNKGVEVKAITVVYNQKHLELDLAIYDTTINIVKKFDQIKFINFLQEKLTDDARVDTSLYQKAYIQGMDDAFQAFLTQKEDHQYAMPLIRGLLNNILFSLQNDYADYGCTNKTNAFTLLPGGDLFTCPDEYYFHLEKPSQLNIYETGFEEKVQNFVEGNRQLSAREKTDDACQACQFRVVCHICPLIRMYTPEDRLSYCQFNQDLFGTAIKNLKEIFSSEETLKRFKECSQYADGHLAMLYRLAKQF